MAKITAPAQVGNGKAVHYVRTDGFHQQAIGCNRPVRTVLTEQQAAKMGKTCGPCERAVEALAPAAPVVEEPAAVEAARVVEGPWEAGHCTPMMGGAVHEVTTGLDGSDGGPVHIFPLCRTGSMTNQGTRYRKVTAELTCRNCIGNRDRRRAAKAARLAAAAAAAVAGPPAAAPAPAVEDGPRVHRFEDTDTAYDITQTDEGVHRGIRDGDVLVVESESVVGVLTNAWPVALTEEHGQFHLMSERYLIREMNDGRYAASADVAERVAAELGLSLLPQHRTPVPAVETAPVAEPVAAPAPADEDEDERTALLTEIGARLSAALVWSTAAAFQPVRDGDEGPVIGWTYRTRSGSEIRYAYVAARGLVLEGFNELRHRADAERELLAHREAGTDAAELMPPVATYLTDVLADRTADQLAKCLHTFNVDVVKTAAEGPGRLIVTRGPDFMGTIFDAGSKSRRGRYEAWSPYAGTRHNLVGFYATVEEAAGRIAHAWPVAAWELAEETGASVPEVLAAAALLAAELADDGVKVLLRIAAATGPDQKITRSAAATLRERLTAAREVTEPAADELDEHEARQRVTGTYPAAKGFEAERDEDGRLIGYTFQVGTLHGACYGWITTAGTFAKALEPYRSIAVALLPMAVRDEQAARG